MSLYSFDDFAFQLLTAPPLETVTAFPPKEREMEVEQKPAKQLKVNLEAGIPASRNNSTEQSVAGIPATEEIKEARRVDHCGCGASGLSSDSLDDGIKDLIKVFGFDLEQLYMDVYFSNPRVIPTKFIPDKQYWIKQFSCAAD